jgi:hypothetical protein
MHQPILLIGKARCSFSENVIIGNREGLHQAEVHWQVQAIYRGGIVFSEQLVTQLANLQRPNNKETFSGIQLTSF